MNYRIEEIKNKLEQIVNGIKEREQEYYENQNWYMKHKHTIKNKQKKKVFEAEELRCLTARHELNLISFDLQNLIKKVTK